jgi:hypothetical protein
MFYLLSYELMYQVDISWWRYRSMVARLLWEQDVGGSNPGALATTTPFCPISQQRLLPVDTPTRDNESRNEPRTLGQ